MVGTLEHDRRKRIAELTGVLQGENILEYAIRNCFQISAGVFEQLHEIDDQRFCPFRLVQVLDDGARCGKWKNRIVINFYDLYATPSLNHQLSDVVDRILDLPRGDFRANGVDIFG